MILAHARGGPVDGQSITLTAPRLPDWFILGDTNPVVGIYLLSILSEPVGAGRLPVYLWYRLLEPLYRQPDGSLVVMSRPPR